MSIIDFFFNKIYLKIFYLPLVRGSLMVSKIRTNISNFSMKRLNLKNFPKSPAIANNFSNYQSKPNTVEFENLSSNIKFVSIANGILHCHFRTKNKTVNY